MVRSRLVFFAAFALAAIDLSAQQPDCSRLPDYSKLKQAVTQVMKEGKQANGGLGNQEWGVLVNRDGIVCAVVFSGNHRGDQWPGSRIIAAEKPIPPMPSAPRTSRSLPGIYSRRHNRTRVCTASPCPRRILMRRLRDQPPSLASRTIPCWVSPSEA